MLEITVNGFGPTGEVIKEEIVKQIRCWPMGVRKLTKDIIVRYDELEKPSVKFVFSETDHVEAGVQLVQSLRDPLEGKCGEIESDAWNGDAGVNKMEITFTFTGGKK